MPVMENEFEESDAEISDDFNASGSEEEEEEMAVESGANNHEKLAASPRKRPQPSGNQTATDAKRFKMDDGKYKKPPTAEEIAHLKETENLFHSNLFRLQISELLSEVTVKEKKFASVNAYVDELSEFLKKIPSRKPTEISKPQWLKTNLVKVPLVCDPPLTSGKVRFQPPKAIHVVGSFALKTCIRRGLCVDLALVIPQEVFGEKDAFNHHYSRRRAIYLATVAQALLKCDLVSEVKVTYLHGNPFMPILVLKPSENHGKGFHVRLHAIPEEGKFDAKDFRVSTSNVTKKWYARWFNISDKEDYPKNKIASPNVNSSVLADLLMVKNQQTMAKVVEGLSGVREGIILLKIWLHQRELDIGYGGVSGFIITMYVVSLILNRKLNAQMSSYQIFRNTLLNLVNSDWRENPPSVTSSPDPSSAAECLNCHRVVLMDSTGLLNMCSFMPEPVYSRLRHEAKISMEFIDAPGMNSFDRLFLTPMTFTQTFDHCILWKNPSCNLEHIKQMQLTERLVDCNGNTAHAMLPSVCSLMNKALGPRVKLTALQQMPLPQWNVGEDPPDSTPELGFGFILNPDCAMSTIDKGPSADTPDAEAFKEFWGEKSELRRFRDGTICEAVVWNVPSIAKQRDIIIQILWHILHRHAHIPQEQLIFKGGSLDGLIRTDENSKTEEEENQAAIIKAFDVVAKSVRMVKDLPLSILTVQGIDPVFRGADVFPAMHARCPLLGSKSPSSNHLVPLPEDPRVPYFCPAFKAICLLEGSGKWPEDLQAIRRLKAAFYVQLSKALDGTEGCIAKANPEFVDVYKSGYVFRLIIGYTHEITVAKQHKTPEGMVQMVETDYSRLLRRQLVMLPKLTSTLQGVNTQNTSFSGCVRLAKRWVASQMLLQEDFMPEEAVELLCAQVFLQPAPFTPPQTPLVGFLRFLKLLSSHDWAETPLCVNLNKEFTKDSYTEIHNHFTQNRKDLPLMFIATPTEPTSSPWTIHGPSAPILNRLALLAQESLSLLEHQLQTTDAEFKTIFRPSLSIYDAVITLKPRFLARSLMGVDPINFCAVSQKKAPSSCMPVVNFDPAQLYLKELKESYGEVALFLHDCYGGQQIGVLWKPLAKVPKVFKVLDMTHRCPEVKGQEEEPMLGLNIPAILKDFELLGSGIVDGVDVKNKQEE